MANNVNYVYVENVTAPVAAVPEYPIEQQLPAAIATSSKIQYVQSQGVATTAAVAAAAPVEEVPVPKETPVAGTKLPRKFASYCRNNYETWKPALFLEEPADPNRRCHYAKHFVYPGNGIEYSPEEIRSRKWETRIIELKRERERQVQGNLKSEQENNTTTEQLQEMTSVHNTQHLYISQEQYQQQQQQQYEELQQQQSQYNTPGEENYEEDEDDDDDDEEECDDDDDFKQSEDDIQSQAQVQHLSSNATGTTVVHTMDDLEDQIEASTIRFSTHTAQGITKNKTIKIKFKKENKRADDSLNGSNYSSYTIENNYQQQKQVRNADW